MSYGPGDNAFVIDRPSAEGGDKKQVFAEKAKAQLDRLYEQLNEDIRPASENKRGLIRIASQHNVDLGLDDASAVTPLTLKNSQLSSDVAACRSGVREAKADVGALREDACDVRRIANAAAERAQRALDAAQGAETASDGMEYPTDATFKAMPAAAQYPYTPPGASHSFSRYEIRLPLMGRWIYCGFLKYHWRETGTNNPNEGDVEVPLCGVAPGGSVIWYATMENNGAFIKNSQTFGFIWKLAG